MQKIYTICATFSSSFVSLHLFLCGKRAMSIANFKDKLYVTSYCVLRVGACNQKSNGSPID